MSKHKRVLHDSTPAGLPRWLRAADNAVRNPNSPAARLYHGRVSLAHQLREHTDFDGPVVFFGWNGQKREYVCSLFCAAMHAQLRYLEEYKYEQHGTKSYMWQGERREMANYVRVPTPLTLEQLVEFFETDGRTNLLSLTGIKLTRPASCVVCRTPVTT